MSNSFLKSYVFLLGLSIAVCVLALLLSTTEEEVRTTYKITHAWEQQERSGKYGSEVNPYFRLVADECGVAVTRLMSYPTYQDFKVGDKIVLSEKPQRAPCYKGWTWNEVAGASLMFGLFLCGIGILCGLVALFREDW